MNVAAVLRPYLPAVVAASLMLALCARAEQEIPGYGSIDSYDAREVAMLPKFCPYTTLFNERVPGGSNLEETARWRSVLGDTFRHIHHYCFGVMKTNRATLLARTEQARLFYLSDSINEFDYVIQRAPEDFVLLPEIITKKGQNLIRLGKAPSGILQLEKAAQLKQDYWPPYAYLSDHYKEAGNLQKAREYLEQGLSFAPDSTALKRRLDELGQTKPRKSADASKASR